MSNTQWDKLQKVLKWTLVNCCDTRYQCDLSCFWDANMFWEWDTFSKLKRNLKLAWSNSKGSWTGNCLPHWDFYIPCNALAHVLIFLSILDSYKADKRLLISRCFWGVLSVKEGLQCGYWKHDQIKSHFLHLGPIMKNWTPRETTKWHHAMLEFCLFWCIVSIALWAFLHAFIS